MPESAVNARRNRARREAERHRREAVTVLRLAESLCGYAAGQLADGLSPEAARLAALEMAGELTAVAESLRRLTRLGPSERRALAKQLHGLGFSTREIAAQVGVSDRAVRYYVSGRVCPPSWPGREAAVSYPVTEHRGPNAAR